MMAINKCAPHKARGFDVGRLKTVRHIALSTIHSVDGSVKRLPDDSAEFCLGWLFLQFLILLSKAYKVYRENYLLYKG